MTARGRTVGTGIAVLPGGSTVCEIKIANADGIHLHLFNSGVQAENIGSINVLVSYTDLVGDALPYPYASQNDIDAILPFLVDGGVGCDILMPLPMEGTVFIQMTSDGGVGTTIDYEYAPIDQSRLGRGIAIDGIDFGIEDDTDNCFTSDLEVDATGVQYFEINPECRHFALQNQSVVPVYYNFGQAQDVPSASLCLGPCQDAGGGVAIPGTGGAMIEENYKGKVYMYDPLGTPALVVCTEIGVETT